jgi:hypothetical protein
VVERLRFDFFSHADAAVGDGQRHIARRMVAGLTIAAEHHVGGRDREPPSVRHGIARVGE